MDNGRLVLAKNLQLLLDYPPNGEEIPTGRKQFYSSLAKKVQRILIAKIACRLHCDRQKLVAKILAPKRREIHQQNTRVDIVIPFGEVILFGEGHVIWPFANGIQQSAIMYGSKQIPLYVNLIELAHVCTERQINVKIENPLVCRQNLWQEQSVERGNGNVR